MAKHTCVPSSLSSPLSSPLKGTPKSVARPTRQNRKNRPVGVINGWQHSGRTRPAAAARIGCSSHRRQWPWWPRVYLLACRCPPINGHLCVSSEQGSIHRPQLAAPPLDRAQLPRQSPHCSTVFLGLRGCGWCSTTDLSTPSYFPSLNP